MSLSENSLYSLLFVPRLGRFLKFSRPTLAFLQYKSFRLDLLTGDRENIPAQELLKDFENEAPLRNYEKPKIFHLFYEFGHITAGMPELAGERCPLAVVIYYDEATLVDLPSVDAQRTTFRPVEFPLFEDYRAKFEKGMEKLLKGECYQFNLTSPFVFSTEEQITVNSIIKNSFQNKEKLGAYAHYTHLGPLNKGLLSNSPECLFQVQRDRKKIYSMPIKGTHKLSPGESHARGFEKLKDSLKDQGELFMITDLVRNDLTAIEMRPARVVAKKKRLDVPGLSHQYSIVETDIDEKTNLRSVLEALFPGGSITGAPKKKVMRILQDLESYERGFYCGSTIALHKDLVAGSINIRSAEIDYSIGEIKYCAGGGVTLNSQARGEFDETYAKMESFLQLFTYQ